MKNKRKLLVSVLAVIMAVVMVLGLILSLIPTASAASSSEIKKQITEMKKEREELKKQMEEIKKQYKENEDEIANIVSQKNVIDQEISLLYAQIDNINEQIAAFNLLIADKQDELDEAENRHKELLAKNKERIRAMEEEGSLSYWAVLFQANSFSDLLDRLNMVEEIAASDQRRLKELDAAAKEVAMAQVELENEKLELEGTKLELDATQVELDAKREEADALLLQLIEKSEELEELHEGFEMEDNALMEEIAQKEQEYNEAKLQEWLAYMATYTTVPPETTSPPTTGSGSGNGGNNSGNNGGNTGSNVTWLRPCSYVMVTSLFGYRNIEDQVSGASKYHQGIDLGAAEGTPIYATRTGRVSIASYSNSAGNYVSINHGDGFSSIYMHMQRYVVSSGQAVSAGQLIGYVGSTGISSGPHLHFGISKNGVYVNPAAYINF